MEILAENGMKSGTEPMVCALPAVLNLQNLTFK